MAALAAVSSLSAQTDSSKIKSLDEVVVTATKTPIRQSQTGKVIVVISHDEINKSVGKTLGQLLNEQAGVSINAALNNAGANQSIYIRGAASGRTLVLIDGIPVYDPSIGDNSFDLNLIPLDNVERIEICKGAQSTLYGSDAIAGVINIITTKPDIKKPLNAKASFAGGNYGTLRGTAQVYGNLADQLIYNVRYSKSKITGFSSAYDSSGKGNFDKDGFNNDVFASSLSWKANKSLTVKGFFNYSHYTTDLDAGPFIDAKNYTNNSKNLMAGFGLQYKLKGTNISANYQYSDYDRHLLRDSVFGQSYYTDQYFGRTQYIELFASSHLGHGFTWLNGTDYRFAAMNEHSNYGNFNDTSMRQVSVYSSLFFTSKSGFNAELGGRFNNHSRYGNNFTYTFNPSFLLNDQWKMYASISSGFKAPTLYQLFSSYGDKNLKPEISINYEAGFQYSTKVFNSRFTGFYRKINDGIDFDNINYVYYNYAQQNVGGIEFENKWQISKQLQLTANYTWLQIHEQTQSRLTYNDTVYHYGLKRPANTINASLGFQANPKWFISANAHYESKRYDVGGYDINYNPLPDAVLNSFVIFNAYSEYLVSKQFKIFVDAKNITNKKFFTIYGYNSIPFMISGGIVINL